MTDANGKFSDKVKLSLREDQGKTFVDVEADPTFLKDSATKFPVTIDPTVNNWDVQRDTFISSANPTTSYSSNTSMETGYDSTFGSTRSLVEFYLPSLPSDSKITSATFSAYQSNADTTNVSVDLYRVTSAWTSSATWNSQPTVGSTPESTVTSNTSSAYWQWNITQLMKDWYSGAQSNYGIMLKQQNEGTSPYRDFNTVNSPTNTPEISINYTIDGIGLEDYWGYSRDGVNVSNGNLVLQDTDVSIPGRGIPVSVTRTYNSRKSAEAGIFGYGWVTNLEPHLIDPGAGPITFIDADGTHHVFGQNPSGGYIAADGVYLDLVKNADGTYVITQMDGTKINFYSDGWINNVVDTNGNTLTFTYDTAGNLTTLTDPTGRKTTFTYGTNGYVSSITDPANHTVNFSYDTNGNLTTVTDAAGEETVFLSLSASRVVQGKIEAGKRPFVYYEGVEYRSEVLARSTGLIGTKLDLLINIDDLRVIRAFFPDGTPFGLLTAVGKWGITPHSLQVRKQINRLKKRMLLHYTNQDDPIDCYHKYLQEQSKTKRSSRNRLAKLQREQQALQSTPSFAKDNQNKDEITPQETPPIPISSVIRTNNTTNNTRRFKTIVY
jgi:YD repeat-containing protein